MRLSERRDGEGSFVKDDVSVNTWCAGCVLSETWIGWKACGEG